jgi:hypothetical protein
MTMSGELETSLQRSDEKSIFKVEDSLIVGRGGFYIPTVCPPWRSQEGMSQKNHSSPVTPAGSAVIQN